MTAETDQTIESTVPSVNIRRSRKQDAAAVEAARDETLLPEGERVEDRDGGTYRVRDVSGVEIATRIS